MEVLYNFWLDMDVTEILKNEYGLTAADEAKDDKIKKLILYPQRRNTERFKIKKRNCPAFLSDVTSLT